MNRYQIKNEEITLEIASAGAEMKSLKDNATGKEYLWNADPAFWGRTSPVLFPIVGNYKDKTSIFEGKSYTLSQHGFARDMEFELVSQKDDEIWFALKDTEKTLEVYPFHFCLSIGYKLSGRDVEVLWKVENTNDSKMYFSIGGHPAFLCPFNEGEKQTDCKISVDTDKDLVCGLLSGTGLLIDEKKNISVKNGLMEITENLFDQDALIVENNQAKKVGLVGADGKPYLEVSFDAPVFGIWSPAGKHAPFICIEPWYGRSDKEDFNMELENREWGNTLEAGETFDKSYKIHIF